MKLTYEQKLNAYYEWKVDKKGYNKIAVELNVNFSVVRHFIRLANKYGTDILKHNKKNKYYSPDEKIRIINRHLINGESIQSVSIDEGLLSHGLLTNWIKSYIENGYNIIEKKRGPKKYVKEENGERITSRDKGITEEKPEIRNREFILKKIKSLNSREGTFRKSEIAKAISELRQELNCSLKYILEVIKSNPSLPQITRSDYYYQISNNDKDLKYDEIMNKIITIFYHHKERYGYRRITLVLRNEGYIINHKTVKRLMNKMGLNAITPRAKYKSYKGDFNGTVKNKLIYKEIDTEKHKTYYKRDFKATKPNEKWTTDVSEFHIASGKLYLSPILDMFNREIVSYNISISPNYSQIEDMLNKAFDKHSNLDGLIFHSDRGWQYQMQHYHKILKDKNIIQSMSRKGNCLDNSLMENFFGKMKNEMFYGHEYEFTSLEDLQKSMEEYIHYYNNERIQTKLKGLTPCQARYQALQSAIN